MNITSTAHRRASEMRRKNVQQFADTDRIIATTCRIFRIAPAALFRKSYALHLRTARACVLAILNDRHPEATYRSLGAAIGRTRQNAIALLMLAIAWSPKSRQRQKLERIQFQLAKLENTNATNP